MADALEKGIYLGLGLAILIGPVFFALLQTSLQRGFFSGVLMAIGISLSDSIYIFITNVFFSFIDKTDDIEWFLGIFGGFILMGIGIMTYLKKPKMESEVDDKSRYRSVGTVIRGFLMNFAHPGVLIFWLSVITLINTNFNYSQNERFVLFTATITTVFITDVLKAGLAHGIKRFLTYRILLWMNRVMGIVLIGFGTHLFLTTLLL